MTVRLNGTDTAMAWYSKEEMERFGRTTMLDTQERKVRRPVPPPLPVDLGVWEKLYAAERAAGVDEFWAVIQVSVSARNWRPCVYAKAEIKSAFFTADWQFHKAPVMEIGVLVAVVGIAVAPRLRRVPPAFPSPGRGSGDSADGKAHG